MVKRSQGWLMVPRVKYHYFAEYCPFCHLEGWHAVYDNGNILHPSQVVTGRGVLIVFNCQVCHESRPELS
jgi:hypothetical protein